MRTRSFANALMAALGALILSGPPSNAASPPLLRTVVGIVDDGEMGETQVWFGLMRDDRRFAFDPRTLTAREAVFQILKDSAATSKSISVHFYVDGATIGFGETKPTYYVHDITYDGKTVVIEPTLPPADPNTVPLPRDIAASNLARGIALVGDPDSREARQALTLAIESEALEPVLKALSLKTRAELNENDALQNWAPGPDRDKLFLAALTDSRAWKSFAPDNPNAASAVAVGLSHLGAVEEAVSDFRAVIAKWPDELFWGEIRIAAAYRRHGDYQKALAALDDLVARDGPQDGMAYHFHRGWILQKAGRFQESIGEFTEGLKNQPDYGGAFVQRACSFGQLGRIQEAIADWKIVLQQQAEWGSDTLPSPGVKHDNERNVEIEQALEAALARSPHAPTDVACTGLWDWGEEYRERSALLPATPDPADIAH